MQHIIVPTVISYATSWAVDRKAPRKLYLEPDAQPERITPYICKIEEANIKKTPIFVSTRITL